MLSDLSGLIKRSTAGHHLAQVGAWSN